MDAFAAVTLATWGAAPGFPPLTADDVLDPLYIYAEALWDRRAEMTAGQRARLDRIDMKLDDLCAATRP